MKIDARRLPGFLRDPGHCRVVLLYGDDEGLIRERADALARSVAGPGDDVFRRTDVDGRDGRLLTSEAVTGAMGGGRRVIRVRQAVDGLTAAVSGILAAETANLVVLESAGLPSRSKLRAVVEASKAGAAIGCYGDDEVRTGETIVAGLQALSIAADAASVAWMATQLGGDRARLRSELEKLSLLVGRGGRAGLEDAIACIGSSGELSVEDALFAATAGDVPMADRALAVAMAEGAEPVAVVRTALYHLQRLARCRCLVDQGTPAAEAARAARPPVFFRRTGPFLHALVSWSLLDLQHAAGRLSAAERRCKTTGAPAAQICRQAIQQVALTAARRSAG